MGWKQAIKLLSLINEEIALEDRELKMEIEKEIERFEEKTGRTLSY